MESREPKHWQCMQTCRSAFCLSLHYCLKKRGGELGSVQHRPSDSPQKKTYLDWIKLTAPWHKNWFTEDKISQLNPPRIETLKESAQRRQTGICCSKIGFSFFISTKEHAYSNTHTSASSHSLTHTPRPWSGCKRCEKMRRAVSQTQKWCGICQACIYSEIDWQNFHREKL